MGHKEKKKDKHRSRLREHKKRTRERYVVWLMETQCRLYCQQIQAKLGVVLFENLVLLICLRKFKEANRQTSVNFNMFLYGNKISGS